MTLSQLGGRYSAFNLVFITALTIIGGCAAPKPVEKPDDTGANIGELVWPLPPDPPRIRYVEKINELNTQEEEKKTSFVDVLAGKEEEKPVEKKFVKPRCIHVDATGRIFVSDPVGEGLIVLDRRNDSVEFWASEGANRIQEAMDIDSDSEGRIYVVDQSRSAVIVLDSEGRFINAFGGKDVFTRPVGIAVDETSGKIYVSDPTVHKIFEFDFDGNLKGSYGERGALEQDLGQAYFNYPTFLETGPDGSLYVVDSMNFRVQKFSQDGTLAATIGQVGKRPGDFNRIKDISLDSQENLYVVDMSFNNFQIFNQEGQLLLAVGEGGTSPGQFRVPFGIDIDSQDRVYVVDSINQRVQIFELLHATSD